MESCGKSALVIAIADASLTFDTSFSEGVAASKGFYTVKLGAKPK